jgi:hypothetical protein
MRDGEIVETFGRALRYPGADRAGAGRAGADRVHAVARSGAGLAVWYNSVGTYQPSGHDDVRLVDFSKPSQNPLSYNNPGSNALFTLSTTNPSHALFNRNGQWNLLSFENVSDVNLNYSGLFMYAEF